MRQFSFLVLIIFFSAFGSAAVYEGSTDTSVTIAGLICNNSVSNNVFWQNSTSLAKIVIVNSTFNTGNCSLGAINGTGWCCPSGQQCVSDKCVAPNTTQSDDCSWFKDASSCNGAGQDSYAINWLNRFNASIAGKCRYINNTGGCSILTSCSCYWDSNSKKCVVDQELTEFCGAVGTPESTCYWTEQSSEDHCSDALGKIIVSYSANGNGPDCVNGTIEYPCSVTIKLPFFDWASFILSLVFISAIYFVMRRN